MSESAAISGTRRGFKELADGTLRFTIDIDPQHRQTALTVFSKIDMPVAIAPLVADFERRQPEPQSEPSPKGGPNSKWVALRCKEDIFWRFLNSKQFDGQRTERVSNEEEAAHVVRTVCGVASRTEFDVDAVAEQRFHDLIRKPFSRFMQSI